MSDFKASIKDLLKNSQYKEAREVVDRHVPLLEARKLEFSQQVCLLHWTTKVYLSAFDLKVLTSESILKINTLLNKATSMPEPHAQLLYLQRKVDIATQFWNADRSVEQLRALA